MLKRLFATLGSVINRILGFAWGVVTLPLKVVGGLLGRRHDSVSSAQMATEQAESILEAHQALEVVDRMHAAEANQDAIERRLAMSLFLWCNAVHEGRSPTAGLAQLEDRIPGAKAALEAMLKTSDGLRLIKDVGRGGARKARELLQELPAVIHQNASWAVNAKPEPTARPVPSEGYRAEQQFAA